MAGSMDSPKMLRETFCMAQAALLEIQSQRQSTAMNTHVYRLGRLIDLIDLVRPLGQDGKHDGRHTPWCGCEDQ